MFEILRVKLKTYAAEAQIARQEEIHQLRFARELAFRQRLQSFGSDHGLTETQVNRIVRKAVEKLTKPRLDYNDRRAELITRHCNAAPLPPEAQFFLAVHQSNRADLHRHRTHIIRTEARIAYLAYGFLRGVPYRVMEQKTFTRPLPDKVLNLVLRYTHETPQMVRQWFAEWMDVGGLTG